MPHKSRWNGFLVMNRTFYELSPELCVYLAEQGHIYQDKLSGSVVVMGARFMPEQALHLAMFAGDEHACLVFAKQKALELATSQLSCFFPVAEMQTEQFLREHQFYIDPSSFIVMKV
jgi:hypothetical protein